MATVQEIVESVSELVAGRVSIEDFEDWSAELSWDAHHREAEAVQRLAYQIRGILAEHHDDLNDAALLQELANAVRPFASPTEAAAIPVGIVVDTLATTSGVVISRPWYAHDDVLYWAASLEAEAANETRIPDKPERMPSKSTAIESLPVFVPAA